MPSPVNSYPIAIPEADLQDLRRRLDNTRWPAQETTPDHSQGPRLATLQHLVEHWQTRYDWRRVEKLLNSHNHSKAEIDGLDIAFLHIRSPHGDAVPLLMTHGWPGSILEFRHVIDPLTNPEAHGGDARDAFHLVIPSMPGFGFSEAPTESGWDFTRIARAWITLMDRLGYREWYAQGGDLGAAVTEEIANLQPAGLQGIHLNFAPFQPTPEERAAATAEETALLAQADAFWRAGSAYAQQQMSKPQTIGYSLADSPVGLAAWIYTLFEATTGTPGDAEASLPLDEIIDNIMLYWLPNAGVTSARLYWEIARGQWTSPARLDDPITVPAAFSISPYEPVRPARRWVENRYPNLLHFTEVEKGGHFAAWEQPTIFTQEVRTAIRRIREHH
ncbi:epoxide hydrolase family protein [Amycolatopsis pithecellobii]|uniref:Alpha/beta fold hydrolase n=1 Tax=Amycolatopsis pithecellobii TaxID=664692 RepID=A0A6N7Z6N5_9PSEU|nr:epoxide hydrolase family protein [Amycolatopsis pithecellobii]MTD56480.1 alpha/beta fold hydrolase [Amycolatopsis pithecellobii]